MKVEEWFMKKMLALLMALILLVSLAGCSSSQPAVNPQPVTKPVEEITSGKLTIWSSGDELGRFVEGFNKTYPDIKVEITVVPNSEFLAKITPTLSSGKDAPDLFTGESDYVKYLVNSPYWDDLNKAPYNVNKYLDDIWDYVAAVGTDKNGTIKALSWQASPGSIIYRRDMAKQYLGTDDPTKVSEMLSSNDKMLEVAKTLKEKSGGKIKMFASWQDIFNMQFSNRKSSWVESGKLVADESMLSFMDMAKTISKSGYDLNTDPWSPAWIAAVESDDTFCYVLPTWGYQFVVKPAAVKTKGQWGLTQGSVPYVKGGTWLGIYKNSNNKELAWKFLEYVTCNTEALQGYAKQYGEYVALKSADEALAIQPGEEVLAGQNLFEFYNQQMSKIPNDHMTEYDGQINNVFLNAVKAYVNGTLSKEDAVAQFKADVQTAYPDINIQ
jgi:ABC-type glycerol-3-phosphate transport system substrate-binding protein